MEELPAALDGSLGAREHRSCVCKLIDVCRDPADGMGGGPSFQWPLGQYRRMAGALEHHDCMSDQEPSDQRVGGRPETRQTVTEMKPVPRLSQAASPSFSRRFFWAGGERALRLDRKKSSGLYVRNEVVL